ncbi:hypothetical protein [Nocardia abscessus]|uniref:hypothetical protein n=1 Tax=Nocardia abscessus TaxID=120957 RepID=UPI00313D7AFC
MTAAVAPLVFDPRAHVCLGAHLAGPEAPAALYEFRSRVRSYDVLESGIARIDSSDVRNFAHLPITVETR